ncbi:histidinol-phosphate transaminase [Corynebacterium sp. 320]|uniref:histidinol-phosphate transaminase n=1 Tax=Corynebacterium TaxID=1716 RepID=UPI00125CC440|nr:MULTISPECIES: histidinol-phosphate transaminase [Corynebacterium]KAB1503202.1 histidinol-phosphate transaminase [Corynebacterium sp. 320]KAB1550585.1 histidinol-phosphate transaminase [Corynebacterium sp. 321]KAB1550946.1 histidinol-phosphate transaminase [Corynebacterium sp. 319]KAB3526999.1 histidinol-phosphate transaminase [Corynebacterium sp. 250]KAB3538491.1 histidinol-phosphate transaminase [Corynebacterium sp. 366]
MIRPDLSLLPAYVPGTSLPGALKLASNESSLPPLPSISRAIAEAAQGVNRYPDMSSVQIRSAIAEWFSTAHNLETPATVDNVAVGNGSSALCLQTIQATCSAGDEVIFAWRSFEAYPILVRVAGAEPVAVPLASDLRHDLGAMADAVNERTKLILVCNPNNPTGTTVTAQEFEEFMQRIPASVQVVLDEAYTEYDRSPSDITFDAAGLLSRYPNVAIVRTMSKAYGLAGLRLGYLLGHKEFVEAVNKVGIPFGVNALAQAAGLAAIDPTAQKELLERVEETVQQRARVLEFLGSRDDVEAVPSQANFVWLAVGGKAQRLDEELKRRHVVARCFAGDGVRVSCTTEEETDQLLEALGPALDAALAES